MDVIFTRNELIPGKNVTIPRKKTKRFMQYRLTDAIFTHHHNLSLPNNFLGVGYMAEKRFSLDYYKIGAHII